VKVNLENYHGFTILINCDFVVKTIEMTSITHRMTIIPLLSCQFCIFVSIC